MIQSESGRLPSVAVIGGGPAGLMAAEVLAEGGVRVDLYDAKPSAGRKFLIAGKGGLNLTHAEPRPDFLTRYGERSDEIERLLDFFGPEELRQWALNLGFDTFIGTSGRVFPSDMKAAPLLRAWLQRLRRQGVCFHVRHRWVGWGKNGALRFETPGGNVSTNADAVVLALGGGSWAKLGSDGAWVPILVEKGVPISPLKPANCGFDVAWSDHFRSRFNGEPVKPVTLSFTSAESVTFQKQGEFIVTEDGVEGSLIYAASALLRDEIEASGSAVMQLDLAPDWTLQRLTERLSRQRGKRSMANHLKKSVGIQGVKAGLLWEFVPREDFSEPAKLAAAIKALPVPLIAPRPLDEAISSAGGVAFEALDERLMIRSRPGVFCAGEMLDWEAPTGGYLLTASFAGGRVAGLGVLDWLGDRQ
jgi:uncharacterized flavoprotein (TIGR03862 family)